MTGVQTCALPIYVVGGGQLQLRQAVSGRDDPTLREQRAAAERRPPQRHQGGLEGQGSEVRRSEGQEVRGSGGQRVRRRSEGQEEVRGSEVRRSEGQEVRGQEVRGSGGGQRVRRRSEGQEEVRGQEVRGPCLVPQDVFL